jgi:hypothetical protein
VKLKNSGRLKKSQVSASVQYQSVFLYFYKNNAVLFTKEKLVESENNGGGIFRIDF